MTNTGTAVGDLYYLSGASVGKRKTKQQKQAKKEKKTVKKAKRKEKVKKVLKKVAKVGLVPAREMFLVLVNLNAAKLATKLARGYQKDPTKIKNFWTKFQGDWNKLKAAIIKGSKQQISGATVGVALEVAIATALPIITVLIPILKDLKANGDAKEEKELQDVVNIGQKEIQENPEFTKTTATMDEDEKTGLIKPKGSGTEDDGTKTDFTPLLLGAAGVAALYVVTQK